MAPTFRFPLSAYIETRRGHTYAYNRAFVNACHSMPAPDYVAVLDDDEYPDVNWLTEMVRVALAYDVEIVGGPVFPVFENPDHWLAKSGLYAPHRYATGRVSMIYGAGSMLIRRTTLEHYLDEPFHNDYAFTGGSDEEFFYRCRRDGRTFAWADEAHVFETTPRSRTTVGYLLRRMFRKGTGATRVERKFEGTARRCTPMVQGSRADRFRSSLSADRGIWRPARHHAQSDSGRARQRAHRRRVRHFLRGIPIAPCC